MSKKPSKHQMVGSMMLREEVLDIQRLATKKGLTPSMLVRRIVVPIVREQLEQQP